MSIEFSIREYSASDEKEWLDLHAAIMVDSYAWWIVIHQKPEYKSEVVDLVAEVDGNLVGLITVEINSEVIDIVEGEYGFVWEFGVHREYRGLGIGKGLIKRAHEILNNKYVINKSIWYSQDEKAQKYYEKLGMKEIERHWQFSVLPDEKHKEILKEDGFDCWEMRGSCSVKDFEKIKKKYNLIEDDDALKPRLCIGYELEYD